MKLKLFLYLICFTLTPIYADYIHIDRLHPGQIRFSSKNVEEKIEKALKKGAVFYDSASDSYIGAYFDGMSLFAEDNPIPVVKSAIGYVVVDGHHGVLAALALELPIISVKAIDDFSTLSEQSLWQTLEERGWAHLRNLVGHISYPPNNFRDLQDDPNRYFATVTARKYPENGDTNQSKGAEYPLWIKIGNGIPFIELLISDALQAHGFHYSYDMDYENIEVVEKARSILTKANIPGLCVVSERKHYSELTPISIPE